MQKACLQNISGIEHQYRLAQAIAALLTLCSSQRLQIALWEKFKVNLAGEENQYQTHS
jgi:hypothetical protein